MRLFGTADQNKIIPFCNTLVFVLIVKTEPDHHGTGCLILHDFSCKKKRSPNNSGNRLETAARQKPGGKLLQTVNSGTEAGLSFRARGSAIHPD